MQKPCFMLWEGKKKADKIKERADGLIYKFVQLDYFCNSILN